jgi:hypothetical protein
MTARFCIVACARLLTAAQPAVAAEIALHPGEICFRVDSRPCLVLGRNPTGMEMEHFDKLLT